MAEAELLWCVEVHAMETLIPQPSREVAERRARVWAAAMETVFAQMGMAPSGGSRVTVEVWPWGAKAHAEELAKHGGDPEDWS